ncbi:M3 family oligoendopeptidase [Pseudalkalibacillus berkeleyi]|uniref:M3 family oligoendopeptidase n=1 Tax=Pseudalkalibacillus berkeleyi TaxID=1069813 RepID=A0ABS9GUE4_9BACL|nr:M3 family oligoendopeptidase [Pseudalkalibacillus berkeleyi]MCF6136459.1 M3 family oligoendopeptidase [Pseudalkalibacillus berkeleyi]
MGEIIEKYIGINMEKYENEFNYLLNRFEKASNYKEQSEWFRKINDQRFIFETTYNYVRLQHFRDMNDGMFKEEFSILSKIEPRYQTLVGQYYNSILNATYRNYLEEQWGKQIFQLAELKHDTYSKAIEDDLKKESQLIMEYHALLGEAVISFSNKELSLSTITPYLNSSDKLTRKKAHEAKYKFFKDNESQFDEILHELVCTRNKIATKLGYSSFIQLGYKRMNRTGHTSSDLSIYRNQVKNYGVPFVSKLRESQKNRIGVEKLKYYDEGYLFENGSRTITDSHQDVLNHYRKFLTEQSPETKAFYNELIANNLMDLSSRTNKMGGNFATYISYNKHPYLFANLQGTANDVRILTHETGHAFQFTMSRHWNIPEYIIPYDSAEIFSFGMERLAWPWFESFFGEDSKRYQYEQLITPFMYMPFASAVDEFEHYLYDHPDVSVNQRKTKWRELEHKYLPERDYDGNEFLESGTKFYEIGHLFTTPFYFMDYDLAHFCAVQLWKNNQESPKETWVNYLEMCRNGGKLPFNDLIKQAHISSPFEANSLKPVLSYIEEWIDQTESYIK